MQGYGGRESRRSRERGDRSARSAGAFDALIQQLEEIERGRNAGTLQLPGGHTLEVNNLRKVFWPKLKFTKGDLMRYYARVSPFLLPVVDRPPAHHEAVSERHRRPAVLPAQRTRQGSLWREDREGGRRQRGQSPDRRRPDHAALHDSARRHFAGSLVLAHPVAACCRPMRHRSRPDAGRDIRSRARRRTLGPRRIGKAQGYQASRRRRAPAAFTSSFRFSAGTPYESGPDFLPDRRHDRGGEASARSPPSRAP